MNKFIKPLLIIAAVIVTLSFTRDFILKSLITNVGSNIVGAPIRMGGFSMSLVRQSIKITDFKMYNPPGFPNEVMLDIPVMNVTCDVGAFFRGKIHLKSLILNLKETSLIKNKEGKLNADSLKIAKHKEEEGTDKSSKPLEIQMDTVELNIGRIVNRDDTVAGPPLIKVYDVGLNKKYANITSAQQLAALIVAEPLKAAGIQGLKVYGAAMLTGVAALPIAAAFLFTGKDYAKTIVHASWDEAYAKSLEAMKASGPIKSENKTEGIISATVNGAQTTLKIKKTDTGIEITISARKFMLPQPEIAAGVLYRLTEKLK
jgi:hypothetical protein